jgi:GTP-binding protein
MRFIDRVRILVESGSGGDCCVSFRREKYVPRGGPDGGDGGRGGDIIIRSDPHLSTLIDFRYKKEYKAPDGARGKGSGMTGRDGGSLVLGVPPGTLVVDAGTDHILKDLVDEEYLAVRGGRGGRGNTRFTSSTRRTPRFAEDGKPGEALNLILELKLIADVGIIGLPNAGKSTLISRISAARPKVADYPFTTLVPNLGVVRMEDHRSFVVADVPGLVEGAHKGIGLGHQFLRHVERTSVLLHLVGLGPGDEDAAEAYRTVRNELKEYASGLADKEFIVALTKSDVFAEGTGEDRIRGFQASTGILPHLVSAVSGQGMNNLLGDLARIVETSRQEDQS